MVVKIGSRKATRGCRASHGCKPDPSAIHQKLHQSNRHETETITTQNKRNINDDGIQPVQFNNSIISNDGLELDVR